jgi:hypothetical protein
LLFDTVVAAAGVDVTIFDEPDLEELKFAFLLFDLSLEFSTDD